ncbi:hypothetical protein F5Y11DRAFT_331816 [Daldinia sp. FL1419]|nr:hypothetical protein F5Y11DRAFT_331816 [Daldinia sp. FL1419]
MDSHRAYFVRREVARQLFDEQLRQEQRDQALAPTQQSFPNPEMFTPMNRFYPRYIPRPAVRPSGIGLPNDTYSPIPRMPNSDDEYGDEYEDLPFFDHTPEYRRGHVTTNIPSEVRDRTPRIVPALRATGEAQSPALQFASRNHANRFSNGAPPQYKTEASINKDLDEELSRFRRDIQDAASYAFKLPADIVPHVKVRLSTVDINALGEWHRGPGVLFQQGAECLMPKVIIRLPERRASRSASTRPRAASGPTEHDIANIDAAKRVFDTIIRGKQLSGCPHALDTLPLLRTTVLGKACFEFRESANGTEETSFLMPESLHVCLPLRQKTVDNRNVWVYYQLDTATPEAAILFKYWAGQTGANVNFVKADKI